MIAAGVPNGAFDTIETLGLNVVAPPPTVLTAGDVNIRLTVPPPSVVK